MYTYSLLLLTLGRVGLTSLLLRLALLQESLGDENVILGGDVTVCDGMSETSVVQIVGVQEENCSRRLAFSTGSGDSMVYF